MNTIIEQLNKNVEPLRQQIINHKVYSVITGIEDLRVFMEYHVYAVWDFMSLLKTLQNNLTCTDVPWFPVGCADTRHLINEIVVGEESDTDNNGDRKSHFELYLDAMQQSGADVSKINRFITTLKETKDLAASFLIAETAPEAKSFVEFTFDIIKSHKDHLQAAIFTFGREDLIPGMFISLVNDINKKFPDSVSTFKYYLDRHIEVDGDHHSHLALQMTANLCGTNTQYWQEAEKATIASLQKRIELWDGIYNAIMLTKTKLPIL